MNVCSYAVVSKDIERKRKFYRQSRSDIYPNSSLVRSKTKYQKWYMQVVLRVAKQLGLTISGN